MPFEVARKWLHPEGIFPAQLVTWEETVGKYGPRVRWTFETNVEREDGNPPQLAVWTGMSFGPKAQINQLLTSMGVTPPSTDDEAEMFNPDDLIGLRVRIQVKHELGNDGTLWANVAKMAPLKEAAPSGNGAAATHPAAAAVAVPAAQPELAGATVAQAANVDPFEQQL